MKELTLLFLRQGDEVLLAMKKRGFGEGRWNGVGGKVEKGEDELHAAYRELEEETGISKNDIILTSLMNFEYKLQDMELEVYVGKLNKEVKLVEEINKLFWIDKNNNFFDVEKYAGEGNKGHMLKHVEIYKDEVLK